MDRTPAKTRAEEINRLHGELLGTLRTSVEKAIRIGQLLAEQKADLAHGEWLPWLEANVTFAERTARNYVRLYEERLCLPRGKSARVADLGLTDAYRAIGVLAESPEPPAEIPKAPKREVLVPEVLPPPLPPPPPLRTTGPGLPKGIMLDSETAQVDALLGDLYEGLHGICGRRGLSAGLRTYTIRALQDLIARLEVEGRDGN